jgi:hypothetical protein
MLSARRSIPVIGRVLAPPKAESLNHTPVHRVNNPSHQTDEWQEDEPLNKLDQFLPGRYQQHAGHDIIFRQESNGGNKYMIYQLIINRIRLLSSATCRDYTANVWLSVDGGRAAPSGGRDLGLPVAALDRGGIVKDIPVPCHQAKRHRQPVKRHDFDIVHRSRPSPRPQIVAQTVHQHIRERRGAAGRKNKAAEPEEPGTEAHTLPRRMLQRLVHQPEPGPIEENVINVPAGDWMSFGEPEDGKSVPAQSLEQVAVESVERS